MCLYQTVINLMDKIQVDIKNIIKLLHANITKHKDLMIKLIIDIKVK